MAALLTLPSALEAITSCGSVRCPTPRPSRQLRSPDESLPTPAPGKKRFGVEADIADKQILTASFAADTFVFKSDTSATSMRLFHRQPRTRPPIDHGLFVGRTDQFNFGADDAHPYAVVGADLYVVATREFVLKLFGQHVNDFHLR